MDVDYNYLGSLEVDLIKNIVYLDSISLVSIY